MLRIEDLLAAGLIAEDDAVLNRRFTEKSAKVIARLPACPRAGISSLGAGTSIRSYIATLSQVCGKDLMFGFFRRTREIEIASRPRIKHGSNTDCMKV